MNDDQPVFIGKPQSLPPAGVSREILTDELARIQSDDAKWREGRVFGIYFPTRPDVESVAAEAHSTFYRLSTHHPEVFPSLQRLERDVVAMAAELFNATDAIGNVTSGGTESIMLAMKAARDRARKERGISAPEAIVPRSAYPAFVKAGDLLGVNVVRIPIDAQFKADAAALRSAITRSTVFIAGSVPTISHGAIDPIADMAEIAQSADIHFHVDASLGGFQLPFLERLGCPVPQFDFRLPGVASLSADLHKYAYAPMGASVLLYRSADTYAYQRFAVEDWVGSTYRTPGLLGSRSGGSIAAAWAVMRYLGNRGYIDLTRTLWEATQRLAEGINRIPGLRVLIPVTSGVLVFGSTTLDMKRLAHLMESKGWSGRPQANPPSIRLLMAPYHSQIVEQYLQDLTQAVDSLHGAAVPLLTNAA